MYVYGTDDGLLGLFADSAAVEPLDDVEAAMAAEAQVSKTVDRPAPPQPVIVGGGAVPTYQYPAGGSSKEGTTTTPWYREPAFIGGVASVVVLTVIGLLVQKAARMSGLGG